jgi:hypothetical protein
VTAFAEHDKPDRPSAVLFADDADQRVERGGVLGDQRARASADALVGQRGDGRPAAQQLDGEPVVAAEQRAGQQRVQALLVTE